VSENSKKGWRDHLKVHPACEAFPSISPEELKALGGDIKRRGLKHRIELWQDEETGEELLIDGRSRLDAMELLGLKIFEAGKLNVGHRVWVLKRRGQPNGPYDKKRSPDETPESFVLSANLHRRHLTAEQKREVIAALLKADPTKSDRAIGKTVKASHHTVDAVRTGMERRGQIAHVATRKDTKGRAQPASKPGLMAKMREKMPTPEAVAEREKARRAAKDAWLEGRTVEPPKEAPSPPRTAATEYKRLLGEWLVASEEAKAKFVNEVGLVGFYNRASDAQRRQLEGHIPSERWRAENGLAGVKTTIAHEGAKGVKALPKS
jgi:hypothetical protein